MSMSLVPLLKLSDVPDGEMAQATLPDGTMLAVYNVSGNIYVTSDVCTHGEVSLSQEGSLSGKIVECGWHFGTFDVTTGEATAMPCAVDLKTYPVEIENGIIHVQAS
jgi:p-cumate 2,3-dioxygenase ferredoxin component